MSRYIAKNREQINARLKRNWRALREAVIAKYGGQCACCHETRYEFLALDHVNGGGGQARKISTGAVSSLYRRLAKEPGVLADYRILCHNCNMAHGLYGYCPHPIADPDDAGMLDVVGFDTATPNLMAAFADGDA